MRIEDTVTQGESNDQWIHDNRHEHRDVFSDVLEYYDKVDVWCSYSS